MKKLQKKQISIAAVAVFVAFVVTGWTMTAVAAKRTVCTITVNSANEKEAFRRHLPKDQYEFVELLERGRADWLESACRRQVHCDVLIVSGHFNGVEFYSDQVDIDDSLPIQEMERASCSASCPGLFSQVKEVYMFGCNSLNPESIPSVAAEIQKSLERSGQSPAEAARAARTLAARHPQSIRDAARRLFVDVHAIYGFSSVAPLGPTAASLIDRYFQSSPGERIGNGSPNRRLLGSFAAHSMTVVSGLSSSDPAARDRAQACRFVDARLSAAEKVAFIHQLLRRDAAEARVFLDEIESFVATLTDSDRQERHLAAALADVAGDEDSRTRFLTFARESDQPAVRVRMIGVARALGWLSAPDYHAELLALIRDLLAKPSMTTSDVDVVCSMKDEQKLEGAPTELEASQQTADRIDHAAVLACLGSPDHHKLMLRALASSSAEEMRMAEVYFRHRPISDRHELQQAATSIASMTASDMQARAIDVLAHNRLSDRESVAEVMRLFPSAKSIDVQKAIAGLIIRSDYHAIATPDTVRMLQRTRLKSSGGEDIIDIVIRRLAAASLAVTVSEDGG